MEHCFTLNSFAASTESLIKLNEGTQTSWYSKIEDKRIKHIPVPEDYEVNIATNI